jgi:hypothetical protein
MTDLELIEMDEIRGFTKGGSQAITSVSLSGGFAFVSLRPKDGQEQHWFAQRAAALAALAEGDVPVELLQFSRTRMRFVVALDDVERVRSTAEECGVAWRIVPRCCKLCLVGSGIARTAGIFYRALSALNERNIPVLSFGDSNVTISIVVPEAHGREAEALLHAILLSDPRSPFNSTITFDAALGRVRINGRERRLGSRQAKLLAFLLDNVGRIVTAEEVARHLFGPAGRNDIAALRVHIYNLRKKVETDPDNPRHIVTVPSQGYLFVR